MILKTEAIILKTFDFRETSKIATFFSKNYGKVKGVLKGIRKDPKKFGSSLEKFSVNDIVYYQYRNSDLHLISQCDLKDYFFSIRQDIKKVMAASYILELVDALMPLEQENPDIYQLMVQYLAELETAADTSKLVHIFQIKTLTFSGFRPHLDCCLQCGQQVKGRAGFSMFKGGLICTQCSRGEDVHTISPATVASILYIEKNDWARSTRLALSPAIKNEMKYILNNFLVFHLERHLKSARFIS